MFLLLQECDTFERSRGGLRRFLRQVAAQLLVRVEIALVEVLLRAAREDAGVQLGACTGRAVKAGGGG